MIRRVASRLHYAWTLLWAAVVGLTMLPFGLPKLFGRNTTADFKAWIGAWSRVVLGGAGIRVEATGAAPPGGAVLVANHQAMLDIPALLLGVDRPFVFVARAELRKIPVVGLVLARSRCVFIDRAEGHAGLAEAAGRLAEGDAILMFPEGTRNYGGPVRRFRPGAFWLALEAGVPVVPVAIQGGQDVLHERRKEGRPGAVQVTVLPAIHPGPDDTALDLAARARDAIVAALPPPDPDAPTTKKPAPRERAPAGR